MEWKPIETAPKDGTLCLVGWYDWNSWHHRISYKLYNNWYVSCTEYTCTPTHWMPLPEPPR